MSKMLLFPPEKPIAASLTLSGSKSISNRLLLLKEVLSAPTSFQNLSESEDTVLLKSALQQIRQGSNAPIDVHHAGTDFRFLTALLSTRPGIWHLTGSERMKERPISELVNALRQLGAEISYAEKKDFPPLTIQGKELQGGSVYIDASESSQFVSALLLISPLLKDGLVLHMKSPSVSKPYIRMSVEWLKRFGVKLQFEHNVINVAPYLPSFSFPLSVQIESDWSSASYWYGICALSKNSRIELRSFEENSLQADACLPVLFKQLGVSTTFKNGVLILEQKGIPQERFEYDFTSCPDIAQTVACTCLGLGIPARLLGLKTLQFKESRRIDALKTELQKFSAHVETTEESLMLEPVKGYKLQKEVSVFTHNDHRMAMSFAALSSVTPGLYIEDPDVVNKSYPAFWRDLQSLGFRLNLQS
jgi:3-phosphoshikimate 1-carboxyvinyltransferase